MNLFRTKRDTSRLVIKEHESYYKKELCGVALAGLALFLVLAFISYNPHDITLFHYTSKQQIATNWCGVVGANCAASMFFLFGGAAYAVILLLMLAIKAMVQATPVRRLLYTMALMCGMTMIAAVLLSFYHVHLVPCHEGGVIGLWGATLLCYLTGAIGSQLISWFVLMIMTTMLVRVSLLGLLYDIVMYAVSSAHALITMCGQGIKRMCVYKKNESDVISDGAHKTDNFDQAFWETVAQEVVPDAQRAIEQVSEQARDRLAHHKLRRASTHITILKTPWALAPNTLLKQNIFAIVVPATTSAYDAIMSASKLTQGKTFSLPGASLFDKKMHSEESSKTSEQAAQRARKVEEKLNHFGIKGSVVAIKPGPVVTMFEYKPEIDSKISKIIALEDDLAMALTAQSMRILAPIPGKSVIGFEISNETRNDVLFADLFHHSAFEKTSARLPMIMGVDNVGNPIVADLATMPHLLVGGATGSGKSVGLNVMLVSLLSKLTPDELKLILIDPKRLEFTPYADIPHLLFPIVTQPTRATAVLAWVVHEMEARYEAMAAVGVRTFNEFCQRVTKEHIPDEKILGLRKSYMVVIIDELADLMMVAGKDVETHIIRIAQMARAAGIHMIVATQRPSVDVVTGLIKVNFPSRVAFRVSSKVDSRTILDAPGAEKLLGRGDMLVMQASSPELKRVHGAYIADHEIEKITIFWRSQRAPEYMDMNDVAMRMHVSNNDFDDELYPHVREFIKTTDEISISMIQRVYRIGFNRSARLIERLEGDGLLAPAQGSKPRKVLH